jgi:hypothetical protein
MEAKESPEDNAVLPSVTETSTSSAATSAITSITNPIQQIMNISIQNSTNMNTVLVSYSPILLTFCIILLSAFSQTTQGLTFFAFLFLFSFIRIIIINLVVKTPPEDKKGCVNIPVVSVYNNDGFNIFYITYLFGYIVAPMINMVPMNYVLLIFLGVYMIWIFIKSYGCLSGGYIVGNFLYGIISVTLTMCIIISCNIQTQLFLYDSVSDAVKCSMPSKQTFKCNVYQNGQLISSSTK